MIQFYLSKNKHKDACDFRTSGRKKTRIEPTGTCKTILEKVPQVNHSTTPTMEAGATTISTFSFDSSMLIVSSLVFAATVAGAAMMLM